MEWNNFKGKAEDICPYKGLTYFDYNDEDPQFFFGREKLINQLLEKIQQNNFLAVIGMTGSGKSSVVRAGLLHRLKLGLDIVGSERWSIRIFRPGGHPLKNLAMAFLDPKVPAIDRVKQLKKVVDLIHEDVSGLARLIEETFGNKPMVLVLDPFEDVFNLCQNDNERQAFFESLLYAQEQMGDKFFLIITLRYDYLKECQNHTEFARLIRNNNIIIQPMNREELQAAILKPAEKVGLKIEPELLPMLLDYIGNSLSCLPLLQYALKKLWKKRTSNCLTLRVYNRLKLMHSFKSKKSPLCVSESTQVTKINKSKISNRYKSKLLKLAVIFGALSLSTLNIYWLFQSQFMREQAKIEQSLALQQLNEKLKISEQLVEWQAKITMQQQELIEQGKDLTMRQAMLDKQHLDFTVNVLNSLIDRTSYHLETTFEQFTIPARTFKNHMNDLWDNFEKQTKFDHYVNGDASESDKQSDFLNDYNELSDDNMDMDELQNSLQDFQQTVLQYEKLLLEFPQDIKILEELSVSYKELGGIQLELGQTQESVHSFQQAIDIKEELSEIDEEDVDAQLDLSFDYEKLGDMQLDLGDRKAALVNFQKALDINENLASNDPFNLEMQRNLSISYENVGDVQLALNNRNAAFDAFHESLKISESLALRKPNDIEMQQNLSINFSNLGLFFLGTEQLEEAKFYFMQALKYGDQHDRVYFNLAQIEELKNHPDQALIWYEKVSESLEYMEAQAKITLILSEQGKWRKAIQRLHTIPVKSKDKLALMQIEAELLTEQKLYFRAMNVYNRALQINPKNVDLLYMRGLLAGKMNCIKQLERDLRHILRLNPHHIEALNALGYSLTDLTDRYEEAYQFIKKVLDLQPDNHYVLDSMGWVLYKMGDYEQALEYLYRAQPFREGDTDISDDFFAEHAVHLGEVLWVSGDEESAKAVWGKALDEFPENEKLREVIQYFIRKS